jgi:hypothetical protein
MVFNSRLEKRFYKVLHKFTKGNLEQEQANHSGAGDSQIELTAVKLSYIQTGVKNLIAEQSEQIDVESEKTTSKTGKEKANQEIGDDGVVDRSGQKKGNAAFSDSLRISVMQDGSIHSYLNIFTLFRGVRHLRSLQYIKLFIG